MNSPIADKFKDFLSELIKKPKGDYNEITYQIFYDLFKIRMALWKYKVEFKRGVDWALSDIFQDIIIHYLRALLPKKFSVLCERKKGKVRPDILIKKNDCDWAIIEIKTTPGWNRDLVKNDNYKERINILSKQFKIPENKIFYIFDSAGNINREFYDKITSKRKHEIKKYIFPLFKEGPHPINMSDNNFKNNKNKYVEYSNKEIHDLYIKNRLNNLKSIITKKIIQS